MVQFTLAVVCEVYSLEQTSLHNQIQHFQLNTLIIQSELVATC